MGEIHWLVALGSFPSRHPLPQHACRGVTVSANQRSHTHESVESFRLPLAHQLRSRSGWPTLAAILPTLPRLFQRNRSAFLLSLRATLSAAGRTRESLRSVRSARRERVLCPARDINPACCA